MAWSSLLPCLVLCITAGVVHLVQATRWASAEMEALDEQRDAEIFKAVLTSMAEYHLRRLSSHHRKKRADASVCYPEVGCFQDSGPFGYLDMLPSPPEEVDTHFLLYSRRNRGDIPLLDVPFSNLSTAWADAAKRFNASSPTKVIVHGFGSSCSHVWVYEMRSALMAVEDCNVICVDWERGATIPNYVRAAANTRMVGKQVALLLAGLEKHVGLAIHRVHVIGFSLGAHVAGFAGAEIKNLSRITGLDPAGPLFESQDPRARLDATDADFVDVIHSNGENLILGGLGTRQPLGHVDFYPNGGRMQKGCANLFVGAVSDILWSASENEARSLCNHRRAYKFFTDSVSPRCHFPAAACDSYEGFLQGQCFPCDPASRPCGNMGYYADRALARGALYLVTREEEPFCAHQYHVRVESSPSVLPVVSYGRIQITLIGDSDLNETFTLTQKDDEQLQVGGALSRIVVPHPAMQEPRAVQLLYSAYSGWISSGLARWSVDKVTLSDSFGKSSSVCKKDLVLESGIPVSLPLFAGECNPPRGSADAQLQAAGPSSETNEVSQPQPPQPPQQHPGFNLTALSALLQSNPNGPGLSGPMGPNGTRFVPTQVVHVGDEGLDEGLGMSLNGTKEADEDALLHLLDDWTTNNGLDDARAFDDQQQVGVTTLGPQDATLPADPVDETPSPSVVAADASSSVAASPSAAKPEISEPVLSRASAAPSPDAVSDRRSLSTAQDATPVKPEITEPVLKPTTTSSPAPPPASSVAEASAEETTAASASASTEVGSGSASRDMMERGDKALQWTPALELNPPPLGGTHIWQHWPPSKPVPVPSSSDKENRRAANNSRAFSFFERDSHSPPPPVPAPVPVHTSERSLTVQLLPQRLVALLEQAERYARLAFAPFLGGTGPNGPNGPLESGDGKRKAKNVPAAGASSASTTPGPAVGDPTPYLVPLSYTRNGSHPRYIPLSKPGGTGSGTGAGSGVSAGAGQAGAGTATPAA